MLCYNNLKSLFLHDGILTCYEKEYNLIKNNPYSSEFYHLKEKYPNLTIKYTESIKLGIYDYIPINNNSIVIKGKSYNKEKNRIKFYSLLLPEITNVIFISSDTDKITIYENIYLTNFEIELKEIIELYNSLNFNSWKEKIQQNDCRFYPNLKNECSNEIMSFKKEIAIELKDITMLPYCTYESRKNAFSHNIYSWDDQRLTISFLNIFKENDIGKRQKIINNIIQANRDNIKFIPSYSYLDLELYIDIENMDDFIYMIGIYDNNNNFIQLIATRKEYILRDDSRILKEYTNIIEKIKPYRIYTWGSHEKTMFNKKGINTINIYDFCGYLQDSGFAIPGLFNHKLKDIGKLFNKLGYITSSWSDTILNGLEAVEDAKKKYESNLLLDDNMEYNKSDVIVMYDIIQVFKKGFT